MNTRDSLYNTCADHLDSLANLLQELQGQREKTDSVGKFFRSELRALQIMVSILVYSVLQHHLDIPPLKFIRMESAKDSIRKLEGLLSNLPSVVPQLGEYLPDVGNILRPLIGKRNNKFFCCLIGLVESLASYDMSILPPDLFAYLYKNLVSAGERKKLGQYYTPYDIAKLMCEWAIQSKDEIILDPGCGCGVILRAAFDTLVKGNREDGLSSQTIEDLAQLGSNLVGIEIDPFLANLATLNLALAFPSIPCVMSTIKALDFFDIMFEQRQITDYMKRKNTSKHRIKKIIGKVTTIVSNPPYTKGRKIPESTMRAIERDLEPFLDRYGLKMKPRKGIEPGLYIHFLAKSLKILGDGMNASFIIPNSWLEARTLGIRFQRLLLENCKIHAIIDFPAHLFDGPDVATCILFLEKCSDEELRGKTISSFIHVENGLDRQEIIHAVNHKQDYKYGTTNHVPQGNLPTNRLWFSFLMNLKPLETKGLISLGNLVEVKRGSIYYCTRNNRGLGANPFFFLKNQDVVEWRIHDYVTPAITHSQDSKHFTLTKEDWLKMRNQGSRCWLFEYDGELAEAPEAVRKYIRFGESECKAKGGVVCSQTQACKERQNSRKYAGWYDVGGHLSVPDFFVPRYTSGRMRFTYLEMRMALDVDFIAFSSRRTYSREQIKALLAYLNSSYTQYFVEMNSRTTGLGLLALEPKIAEEMPVLNIIELKRRDAHKLAEAFDELDSTCREAGGALGYSPSKELEEALLRLDETVASVLGMDKMTVSRIREGVNRLMKRRHART